MQNAERFQGVMAAKGRKAKAEADSGFLKADSGWLEFRSRTLLGAGRGR